MLQSVSNGSDIQSFSGVAALLAVSRVTRSNCRGNCCKLEWEKGKFNKYILPIVSKNIVEKEIFPTYYLPIINVYI